jgi:transposase
MTGNSAINNFLSLTCINIVSKLWQVEVFMGQGMSRLDAIRQIGVVAQTYYRWRKQYGGMGVDQLKQLKRLEKKMSV